MLTDGQRRSFAEDGYLVVKGVFHVDELSWLGGEARALTHGHAVRSAASAWSSDEAPAGSFINVHQRQEAFRRLATHPRLRALAASLTGGPVRLLRTRLLPGRRQADPIWRQDAEFWRRTGLHDGASAVTAAIVLDGHYAETGALRVLPGSHRPDAAARPAARLSASLGTVILLHCAARYALAQPDALTARPALLVTYDAIASTSLETSQPERYVPQPPNAADGSLWPVPIWIAG